jgi:hypothetical protein
MEQFPIMGWVRLLTAIAIFVLSCTGLGYLVGIWSRRLAWSWEVCVLMCVFIACIHPAIFIADSWHAVVTCQPRNPDQVCDAPIYALIGAIFFAAPIIFMCSLALALPSARIARQ